MGIGNLAPRRAPPKAPTYRRRERVVDRRRRQRLMRRSTPQYLKKGVDRRRACWADAVDRRSPLSTKAVEEAARSVLFEALQFILDKIPKETSSRSVLHSAPAGLDMFLEKVRRSRAEMIVGHIGPVVAYVGPGARTHLDRTQR